MPRQELAEHQLLHGCRLLPCQHVPLELRPAMSCLQTGCLQVALNGVQVTFLDPQVPAAAAQELQW